MVAVTIINSPLSFPASNPRHNHKKLASVRIGLHAYRSRCMLISLSPMFLLF